MRDIKRNDRSYGHREMFQAICSNCGNSCEVPFKPTGSKPIYCNNCFKEHGDHGPRRSEGGNFRSQSNVEDRTMYDATCDNCGNRCSVPFEPRNGKPVYCSDCFEKRGKQDFRQSDARVDRTQYPQFKEQFDKLNTKLDKLIHILSKSETPPMPTEELVVEEVEKVEQPQEAKEVKKAAKKRTAKKPPVTE